MIKAIAELKIFGSVENQLVKVVKGGKMLGIFGEVVIFPYICGNY